MRPFQFDAEWGERFVPGEEPWNYSTATAAHQGMASGMMGEAGAGLVRCECKVQPKLMEPF